MRPSKPPGDTCPHGDSRDRCNLVCKFNYFQRDDLTIHSWELKCVDCGVRHTVARRSDEDPEPGVDDPARCPFCLQTGLTPGRNPCGP
jgi:hypothetical protein